ncbi:hypothetical protein BV22DRAFT_1134588 [Leucogyrophana mollusca]|uniref:Uncharacterized protein n=1 Tax=Leucogyrophana mollusca TaxID=85980 RepID=A0ACB8AYG5_9AGAM|nr:hypothetical protein BV22DRAFT_1134588 [Leucogyrophana mollusca]
MSNQVKRHAILSQDSSFITETSFTRAPLNSRVSATPVIPNGTRKVKHESLGLLPLDIQEALILEDLSYILTGIEGTYITYDTDCSDDLSRGMHFILPPSLDPSLRDLTERILPTGTYYTAISSFIEQRSHFDYGLVNHALCAVIRDMLRDYQTLLSQLDHVFNNSSHFTLTKLWFYLHPTLRTLSLIYHLVLELQTVADASSGSTPASNSSSTSDAEADARDEALGLGGARFKAMLSLAAKDAGAESDIVVKGGEVLTIIYERMQSMSGDPTARALHSALLRAAGKPYVAMIRTWTTTGRLLDPCDEFCVKENKFINLSILEMDYTDEYWDEKYTVSAHSPSHFAPPSRLIQKLQLRDGSTTSPWSRRHRAGVPYPRPASRRLPGGACIPPLLEGWKHKILLAGRYLNVIRECSTDIAQIQFYSNEEELSMHDEKLYDFIENAYQHANHTLLQLLLKDQQLIPRLRTLKRYFLLSQSTYLRHFLELSHTELRKSAQSVSITKLQSLLDLAVNTDAAEGLGNVDDVVFREDLKVTLAGSELYEWLLEVASVNGVIGDEGSGPTSDKGRREREKRKEKERDDKKIPAIDALVLDYTVKFPLSLVISRKTILNYQLLFRFLLYLKHVEQSLSSMWIEHKTSLWRHAVPNHPELEKWRFRIFLLRAKMLAYVQEILAFSTFEVLEPNWRVLETKLAKVTTVDQLMMNHADFLDTCLKGCMLTSSKLLNTHSRLMVTCSTFAQYTSAFSKHVNKALAAVGTSEGDQEMAERWVFLSKFETHFDYWFNLNLDHIQLDASSGNVSLLPLVMRLKSIQADHA